MRFLSQGTTHWVTVLAAVLRGLTSMDSGDCSVAWNGHEFVVVYTIDQDDLDTSFMQRILPLI